MIAKQFLGLRARLWLQHVEAACDSGERELRPHDKDLGRAERRCRQNNHLCGSCEYTDVCLAQCDTRLRVQQRCLSSCVCVVAVVLSPTR